MKITLDLARKTVQLEANINLEDFTQALEKLLPGGAWREYELVVGSTFTMSQILPGDSYREPPFCVSSSTIEYPWINPQLEGPQISNTGVYVVEIKK